MRFLTNLDVYGSINLFGELKVNDKNLITIGEDGGMQLASSAYFINDGDTKVTLNDLDLEIRSVRSDFDALVGNGNSISGAIDTFNEIKLFLADYKDSTLSDIINNNFVTLDGLNIVHDYNFYLESSNFRLSGQGSLELSKEITINDTLIISPDAIEIKSDYGDFTLSISSHMYGVAGLAVNDEMVVTFDDDETLGQCITMEYDPWGSWITAKLSVDGLEFVESDKTARYGHTGTIIGPDGQMLEATRYGGYIISSGSGASVGVVHAGDDRDNFGIVHLGAQAIRISTSIANGGDYNNDQYLEISRTPEGVGFNTYDTNTETYLDMYINGHKILTEANFSILRDITITTDNQNVDGTYTTSIEHNFNFMYPSVSVYDANHKLVACSVTAESVNEISITVNAVGTYHVSIRK